jgi:hypothetical protein
VFETWRDYVVGRTKLSTIAGNTAWRQLENFARRHDLLWPAHVTPKLMRWSSTCALSMHWRR